MAKKQQRGLGAKAAKKVRKAVRRVRRSSPVALGIAGVGGVASSLLLSSAVRTRVRGAAESVLSRAERFFGVRAGDDMAGEEQDEAVDRTGEPSRSVRAEVDQAPNGIAGGVGAV